MGLWYSASTFKQKQSFFCPQISKKSCKKLTISLHSSIYIFLLYYILLFKHCSGFGCSQTQKRHAATPPPTMVRRRIERNRQKLVGRDKGSLTEQQTKGTVTTMIQIRRIHKTKQQNTERAALTARRHRTLPSRDRLPASLLPHWNSAWRHMVWNTRLCFARLGQPTQLCPFLDSGEY